jgi:hypothetical protein
MFKITPNPPETDPATPQEILDPIKLKELADRALAHYLNPPAPKDTSYKPSTMFLIAPGIDTESLMAHACESLASASVLASDFAASLEGPQRKTMLALQQVIMLAELAVNRALDNLDPQG